MGKGGNLQLRNREYPNLPKKRMFFRKVGRFERKEGNRDGGRKGADLKSTVSPLAESQDCKGLRVHSRLNLDRSGDKVLGGLNPRPERRG